MRVKQEVETGAVFEMAKLYDKVAADKASHDEKILCRLLIALLKKETAEQSILFARDAIEMHGGNGYIEDFVTPRLLRDAQVLTVWEGTSNILGLEVLRLFQKYEAHQLFFKNIEARIEKVEGMLGLTHTVRENIRNVKKWIGHVLKLPYDLQTFHCKTMAKMLCDLYEGVYALTRAYENTRKQKTAEVFIFQYLESEEELEKPLTLQYAEEVLQVSLKVKGKS